MDRTRRTAAFHRLRALLAETIDHIPVVILVRSLRAAWFAYRSRARPRTKLPDPYRLPRRYVYLLILVVAGTCLDRARVPEGSAGEQRVRAHAALRVLPDGSGRERRQVMPSRRVGASLAS